VTPSADAEPLLTLDRDRSTGLHRGPPSTPSSRRDELSPSGSDLRVSPPFIDRQLAGAYGMGCASLSPGAIPQGQPRTRLSASRSIRASFFRAGHRVRPMPGPAKDLRLRISTACPSRTAKAALKAMEEGKGAVPGPSRAVCFFDALLQITMEGFFSPTRSMVGTATWRDGRWSGYPGLPATYRGG